jgi:hypothetical protein
MPLALRMPLLVAIALVLGIALWGGVPVAANGRDRAVVAAPVPAGSMLPLGAERDLVRALWVLLSPPQRAEAHVAEAVTRAVFVGRALPPSAISHGRGVWVRDLDPGCRVLVRRLYEHAVALAAPHRADPAAAVPDLPDDAAFAFAGVAGPDGDLYLRWHLPTAVCEWVGFAGGGAHARFRSFADATTTWLGRELAGRLAR